MPPLNLTKRFPRATSSAWASDTPTARARATDTRTAIFILPRRIPTQRLTATRHIHPNEVAQMGGAVAKTGKASSGRAMLEVHLVLAQPVAGTDRVDRHPDLHAEPAGEGKGRLQGLDPQGP